MSTQRPRVRSIAVGSAVAGLLLASHEVHALPGDLDASFGSGGIVTTPIGLGDDRALAAIPFGADGVLVAGWTHNGTDRDVALAAYDSSGALVPSFGSGGIVAMPVGTGDDVAEAIISGPDGRPVIAGWTDNGGTMEILLIRYDGGIPDPTFGINGIVRTPVPGGAQAFALAEHQGGFVVTGGAGNDLLVARYDAAGQLDPLFGVGGIVVTPAGGPAAANAVGVFGGGNILLAGWVRRSADADILLARYERDGRLMQDFGTQGIAVTPLGAGDDVAEAMLLDGTRVYVAGWSGATSGQVVLARYTRKGELHSNFGVGGVVQRPVGTDARALALAVEHDGGLLAAGWASAGGATAFLLLRHDDQGVPDSTFGTNGVVLTPIGSGDAAAEAVLVLRNEHRMVIGHARNGSGDDVAVARYLPTPRCGNGFIESEIGETCDDRNLIGGDCCAGNCQLEPAGTACGEDTDPCTDDHCDAAGVCVHPIVGPACGPHLCYRGSTTASAPPPSVALASAFHVDAVSVRDPQSLCVPASVDGAPIGDPTLGQEAYRTGIPRYRPRQNVRVSDRFGTLRLNMLGADRLLVPTRVDEDAPPPAPPPEGTANFFECYRVRRARGAPPLPDGLQATVADVFASRRYDLRRVARLCAPVAVDGSVIPVPAAYLVCYDIRPAAGEPRDGYGTEPIHTANALGAGQFDRTLARELCIPALAHPCDTLPPCQPIPLQTPDCTYAPTIIDPTHFLCRGPTVLIDATHANFHTLETDGLGGRYWGFARLLSQDGYVVDQSEEPVVKLLRHSDVDVLVIANPTTDLIGGEEAVPAQEVAVIADWVRQGGSLLLVIDHDPYERVGLLLAAFGLERLPIGDVSQYTFTRESGDLRGASAVANGPRPDTAVDEVTTFRGTAFGVAANPPSEAQIEPVLVFPPGVRGFGDGEEIDLGGYLQGVAIRFGAGRVFVAGEAGGLTAQDGFGMQFTPDNERYLRNILWWLTE